MARKDDLAKRLTDEIESVIGERLSKIGNPVIRKAIEDTLRDQVYENIGDAISGQVKKVVDESMDDIMSSIQGAGSKKRKSPLQQSFSSTPDSGGKSDSGGKDSAPARAPVRRTPNYSSGGKGGGK